MRGTTRVKFFLAFIFLACAEHNFSAQSLVPLEQVETGRFIAVVSVGSPPQKLKLAVDSLTSNLWFYSKDCWNPTCFSVQTYNHASSSTYVADGTQNTLRYPDTAQLSGYESIDLVSIGGYEAANFPFLEVTNLKQTQNQDNIMFSDIDGVLPLGYPGGSRIQLPGFWATIDIDNPTLGNLYSVYFGFPGEPSYLILGGIDSHFYTGSLSYHKLLINFGWSILIESVHADGQAVENFSLSAMIMTAQPFIYGPPEAMQHVVDSINVLNDCSNKDQQPNVTFSIEGQSYVLTPKDYILETDVTSYRNLWGTVGSSVFCESGLRTSDISPGYLFGSIWTRKFYTVFDYGNQRVGFAEATRF